MKDLDELMMESFIEVVDNLRRASGMKHIDFISKVWPESPPASARVRWHNMRSKTWNTGKPQGVLITDAYRMAKALNSDVAYLFFQAEHLVKAKMTETPDEEPPTAAVKATQDRKSKKPAKSGQAGDAKKRPSNKSK